MIGQYKRNFKLVPYQNDWNDHFKREADLLISILGEKVLRIEHIGSTSIPGMSAKAIIDIMVAVPSLKRSSDLILGLDNIGYVYKPFDIILLNSNNIPKDLNSVTTSRVCSNLRLKRE